MILALRKHLYCTNIVFFFIVIILQKFITLFCIIEEKACKNKNCSAEDGCDEHCMAAAAAKSSSAPSLLLSASSSSTSSSHLKRHKVRKQQQFTLVPTSMRKAMRNFGFGEGHYQIFVEEKQRYQTTSEARLNAADAELKLNPN